MPYMEHQFLALTGVHLKGLSQFTVWIKAGSYYHGVVAKKGQLNMCPHLAGCAPPMRPQICPSETQALTQRKVGTLTARPHAPGKRDVATQGAPSDAPMPMETGGAGDGHSWVEQVNTAYSEEEWKRGRPAKHPWASSTRQDPCPAKPFPLQDSEGRHMAVQWLYCNARELAPAKHDVAAQGMAIHHPDLEAGTTNSLNNMVLCIISEYHLMCLSQGPSYVSLVILEAAEDLLPPMEEYQADGDFQGTWNARVLEKAKILQVAVWLHRLDMATTGGDREASYSLDTCEHKKGPLLEFLLIPQVSSLMFEEVVHQVLIENQDKMESSLSHVWGLQAQL